METFQMSRRSFPRDPSFQKAIKQPRETGETAGFRKQRWFNRMGNQPLEDWSFDMYMLDADCSSQLEPEPT